MCDASSPVMPHDTSLYVHNMFLGFSFSFFSFLLFLLLFSFFFSIHCRGIPSDGADGRPRCGVGGEAGRQSSVGNPVAQRSQRGGNVAQLPKAGIACIVKKKKKRRANKRPPRTAHPTAKRLQRVDGERGLGGAFFHGGGSLDGYTVSFYCRSIILGYSFVEH